MKPPIADADRAFSRADAALLALLLGVAAAVLWGWFGAPIHRPQDEGLLLVYPELLLRGQLPQRDFFASYPIGGFALIAASYELFGVSVASERAVGLLARLAIVASLFALTRSAGAAAAFAVGVASLCMMLPLRLDAYAWLSGLSLLLASLVLLRATGTLRSALAGALAAFALTCRLDLGVAWLLATLPLLWGAAPRLRRRYALGCALGALPLLAHALAVGPIHFVDQTLIEPVFRVSPLRAAASGGAATPEGLRQIGLVAAGVVGLLAVAWAARRDPTEGRRSASLAGLALGLLPQALQGMDEDHLLYVGAAVAGLVPFAAARMLDAAEISRRARTPLLACFVLFSFVLPVAPILGWLANGTGPVRALWVEHAGRRLPVASERERAAVTGLAEALAERAKAGDRLFIGPVDLSRTYYGDLHLYFLFPELRPASYYLEMNPGSADREGSRLAADLATAHWVIATTRWGAMGKDAAWRGSREPGRVLRTRFAQRADFAPWFLFGRREPGRGDP